MPKLIPEDHLGRTWIGIDPGANGGIAWHSVARSAVRPTCSTIAYPMPTTERDVWALLASIEGSDCMCLIEGVHSFPKQGVVGSFTFGRNYGFLRGCLISLEIPFEEVTPRTWQKELGVTVRGKAETKSAFKQRLKARAQQLFPKLATPCSVSLKTADALLIMEHCRRKFQ